MDIAFLGGLFPKHKEAEIITNSRSPIDFAANNLQWAIIHGFDLIENCSISLINVMFIGSYPNDYKKLIIRTETFSHKTNSHDINLGYFNLVGIKMLFRCISALRGLLKWASKNQMKKIILIYSIHTPYILASLITRLVYTDIKICIIVPDLPQYMSDSKNIIYRIFKYLDMQIIKNALIKINGFVLLTKAMSEKLNIHGKPHIVIEGIFDSTRKFDKPHLDLAKKIVLYAGTISSRYGLLILLNAFTQITNEYYELWICGDGDLKAEILRRQGIDFRIKYFGKVSIDKAFELMQKATVLVNPRTSDGEYTKYSFPSKVINYLASGTPTIMFKLPGIPEEYFKYCFIPEEETVDSLYKTIYNVCEMDHNELKNIGYNAQKFILEQKNPYNQAKKIFDMITKI